MHALIDTGALITGMDNEEVAHYLVERLPPNMEGVVYLDRHDRTLPHALQAEEKRRHEEEQLREGHKPKSGVREAASRTSPTSYTPTKCTSPTDATAVSGPKPFRHSAGVPKSLELYAPCKSVSAHGFSASDQAFLWWPPKVDQRNADNIV